MGKIVVVDFSQIATANMMVDNRIHGFIDEVMAERMLSTSLRSYVQQFGSKTKYILAVDDKNYWRRDFFPHYKMHRPAKRAKVKGIDWDEFYRIKGIFSEKFMDFKGFHSVRVERAEADDIIGVVCFNAYEDDEVIIISNDKDFKQLQRVKGIKQLNPIDRNWIYCKTPLADLKHHIIKGDRSDGIPNILSDDDTFMIEGKRQSPLRTAYVNQWMLLPPKQFCDHAMLRNYRRNRTLIDMTKIPKEIEEAILNDVQI